MWAFIFTKFFWLLYISKQITTSATFIFELLINIIFDGFHVGPSPFLFIAMWFLADRKVLEKAEL